MKKTERPTVVYDPEMDYDCAQGGLRIYIPDRKGCINYNLGHSVTEERNADIHRLTVAAETDFYGNLLRHLTKDHAEWDMAIRLADRPDFIGGYNHGDELETAFSIWIDGEKAEQESLTDGREFSELKVCVRSVGYDPKAQSDAVFEHEKEYCFTQNGVDLHQKITWLKTVELDQRFKSYLAMMPPLKKEKEHPKNVLTDTFYTDRIPQTAIKNLPIDLERIDRYTVLGKKSGISFTMEVKDYHPLYQNGYHAHLSDNGGANYNKMYIAFAGGARETVEAGTVWSASTHYEIHQL